MKMEIDKHADIPEIFIYIAFMFCYVMNIFPLS